MYPVRAQASERESNVVLVLAGPPGRHDSITWGGRGARSQRAGYQPPTPSPRPTPPTFLRWRVPAPAPQP